jgi:hypothetical protein
MEGSLHPFDLTSNLNQQQILIIINLYQVLKQLLIFFAFFYINILIFFHQLIDTFL